MFKISKLKEVTNEKINISKYEQESFSFVDGKKVAKTQNILTFSIESDKYSLSFELDYEMEKLLELNNYETIDFSKYAVSKLFNTNDSNGIEPNMNIKLTKYADKKFIVYISFFADLLPDIYSGVIEFSFDYVDLIAK